MNKVLLLFIVLSISACVTPTRVQSDYERAAANDRRAERARQRGSLEEADHYEKEADKLRHHDGPAVIVGGAVEAILGKDSKESEDSAWE